MLPAYDVSPVTDGVVIAAAAAAIAIPYALSSELIHPRCPCDPAEVNALDRHVIGNHNVFLDTTSDVTAVALMFGLPFADALTTGFDKTWLGDTVVFAETLLVNGALVTAAKYTVQRPLPRTYEGDPKLLDSPGGYRSFYSGHTSITFAAGFAAADAYDQHYGPHAWPYVAASVLGVAVAGERIAAGRHFYSDVAVGALAGSAVGLVVPWLHRRNAQLSASQDEVALTVTF